MSGRRRSRCSSGWATRSSSRRRRPAAGRCTPTPATRATQSGWCATTSTCSRPPSRTAARPSWRRPARAWARSATSTRRWPAAPATKTSRCARRPLRHGPTSCPSCSSTCSGVTDVGASYPHRVTYHPTCHSLRLLRVGDRPLQLLRAVRGIDLVELPAADTVLRLRRHLRAQERRHLDRDAGRQDEPRCSPPRAEVVTAGDSSCLMHIGGGLSRLRTGVQARAPGRDPGGHES